MNFFPLGLITEVFMGPEKMVHSESVRHNGIKLHLPLVKLCLLEPKVEDKECASEIGRRAGEVWEYTS